MQELIAGCRKNNKVYQERLYEEYSGVLYRLALKYSSNDQDAQDVLHDSFMIIYSTIKKFKGTGSFEGWMKRIVIFQAIKKYKRSIKEVPYENEWNQEVTVDSQVVEGKSLDRILKEIQALPDQYRLVFNLYQMDGYSHEEIATMLGIQIGTSKSNLFRAKKILKENLERSSSIIKKKPHGVE